MNDDKPAVMRKAMLALVLVLSNALAQDATLLPPDAKFPLDPDVSGEDVLAGTTASGVLYRIHRRDGSGVFQGTPNDDDLLGMRTWERNRHWEVACQRDAMTDRVSCYLRRANLWVRVGANGRPVVSVGDDHYPGSTVAVRIDDGKPRTASAANDGDFDEATSARIVAELKKARHFVTRYMEWPYRHWRDTEAAAYGFAEAYEYIVWAARVATKRRH